MTFTLQLSMSFDFEFPTGQKLDIVHLCVLLLLPPDAHTVAFLSQINVVIEWLHCGIFAFFIFT